MLLLGTSRHLDATRILWYGKRVIREVETMPDNESTPELNGSISTETDPEAELFFELLAEQRY